MKLNEHGLWVEKYPVRLRTLEECDLFMKGEIKLKDLPQPGTKEYDDAPYEQGFIMYPPALEAMKKMLV